MSRSLQLDILCPTKQLFAGEVTALIAPGSDGFFGVLVDHAPMLAGLTFGILCITTPDNKKRFFVLNDGFFEVRNNRASILVDTCECAEDIIVERARASRERAEKRLADHAADIDIDRAKAALLRALTRLHAASLAVKS